MQRLTGPPVDRQVRARLAVMCARHIVVHAHGFAVISIHWRKLLSSLPATKVGLCVSTVSIVWTLLPRHQWQKAWPGTAPRPASGAASVFLAGRLRCAHAAASSAEFIAAICPG